VSLRWRIALAFMLLTAVLLVLMGAQFRSALLRQTRETAAERLLAEARLVAAEVPAPPWTASEELAAWVSEQAALLEARVTLIRGDGTIAGDSESDPATMENHSDRAERLDAVRGGWGSAVRWSETLGIEMLYVAVAVGDPRPAAPVVRLAVPLTTLRAASREAWRSVGLALAVVAGVVLVALPWVSRALMEPVERLVVVARRVARGDLAARVSGPLRGEMAELAQVLNDAVERLAGLLESSRREAGRYAAILEQMSDVVVIVDGHRKVELVNAAFGRLLEVKQEEVVGEYLDRVARNYELSHLLARALEQGAPQRDEVRLLHPTERTLVGVANPLRDDGGEVTGAVGLLHDVTDLYRADEVRRDFVANASHELRTPAAGIKALAEALEAGALADSEKGPEFVRQIVEATDRLTAILDDMLILTRLERGQELLHAEWVEAGGACAEALGHVAQRARAKGIKLECTVAEGDRVYADPASLQTVLINLLDNAVKYTPTDGAVVVRGRETPEGYEIEVSDTGPGIPEADRERIFERFYRVDRARDRATGGTGLGLAIVRHTVEAHGGRVLVDSALGEGTTFRTILPEPASDQDR